MLRRINHRSIWAGAIMAVGHAAGCMALLLAASAIATAEIPESVLRKTQAEQRRAKALASELVGTILDTQLKQLEENQLTDLPIYVEIKLMQTNIEQLVDTEMTAIVDLLASAMDQDGDKRQAMFGEARETIRQVVKQLSSERRSLLRRLKLAELSEQTRRLIDTQTKLQASVVGLAAESTSKRESLALTLQEDQRDVRELFRTLEQGMADMGQWEGPIAETAIRGLKVLADKHVGSQFDAACEELDNAQYRACQQAQQASIDGLKRMLELLETSQGESDAAREQSRRQVEELLQQQAAVLEETKKLDQQMAPVELVQKQADIQKQIDQLKSTASTEEAAERAHKEAASQAALEAAAGLIDNDQQAATAKQQDVLGHLAALKEQFESRAANNSEPKSSAQLADEAAKLANALAAVQEARRQQPLAADGLKLAKEKSQVREAIPQVGAVGDKLQDAKKNAAADKEAAQSVTEALAAQADWKSTAEAVADVSKDNSAAVTPAQTERVNQAGAKAKDRIERAEAVLAAALKATQQKASAARIGEMARGAEALERLAAVERDIAGESLLQAEKGLNGQDAQGAQKRQESSIAAAEMLKASLPTSDPTIQAALDQGIAAAKESSKSLNEALAKSGVPPAGQPAAEANANTGEANQTKSNGKPATPEAKTGEGGSKSPGDTNNNDNLAAKANGANQNQTENSGSDNQKTAERQPLTAEGREAFQKSGAEAFQAADAFSNAAQSLRDAVKQTAEQLASKARQEAAELRTAATAVRDLRSEAANSQNSLSSPLEQAALAAKAADIGQQARSALPNAGEKVMNAAQQLKQPNQGNSSPAGSPKNSPPDSSQPASSEGAPVGQQLSTAAAQLDIAAARQEAEAQVAEAIGRLAQQQATAATALQNAGRNLAESLPVQGRSIAPKGISAPAVDPQLKAAQEMFAKAQSGIGQGAAQLAKQSQLGNDKLAEALSQASSASAPADSGSDAGSESSASDAGQAGSESAAGEGSSQQSPGSKAAAMGNRFQPRSPEYTAAMMAGPNALAQALQEAQAREGRDGSGSEQAGENSTTAGGKKPGQGTEINSASNSDNGKDGESADGKGSEEGSKTGRGNNPAGKSNQSGMARNGDSPENGKPLEEQAWFAKLPPELRGSIRASANQRPPRAYEERVKRYFESSQSP